MTITLIGDVHGKMEQYLEIASRSEYTLQVGDLGFGGNYIALNELDSTKHRVLLGNHDDYLERHKYSHFLSDYGQSDLNGIKFFYMRGGYSIDWNRRVEGVSWWPEEELSTAKMYEAVELYSTLKPDVVISHECPASICDLVDGMKTFSGRLITPSKTAQCLQAMLDVHRPKDWYFGHHHKSWGQYEFGTYFRCLAELEELTLT